MGNVDKLSSQASVYPRHIVFVTAIVEDRDGNLLLIKSPRRGWEPVGGQVELGEDLVDALVREAKEESGYDIEVLRLVNIVQNTGAPGSEPKVGFTFQARLVGGEARTSDESLEVGWFTPQEAMELIEKDFIRDRVADALEFDGTVKLKVYKTKPEYKILRQMS